MVSARSRSGEFGIEGVSIFFRSQRRTLDKPETRVAEDIAVLTSTNASSVRLPLTSRFSGRTLADHAENNPGLGLVASSGREYIVAGQWRRRPEIAELIEASSGDSRADLLERLCQTLAEKGFELVVLDYSLAARDPGFFRRQGFSLIERILEYERPNIPVARGLLPTEFTVRPYAEDDRGAVLALERESFPWLWWNSDHEWDSYVANAGVDVLVGAFHGEVVGYAGFVMFRNEGHLDRLAVHRDFHGQRFGACLLTEALGRMISRGAVRVALTTQEDNVRSQRLYEQNGFHRARWTYEIHGKWLAPRKDPPS